MIEELARESVPLPHRSPGNQRQLRGHPGSRTSSRLGCARAVALGNCQQRAEAVSLA